MFDMVGGPWVRLGLVREGSARELVGDWSVKER